MTAPTAAQPDLDRPTVTRAHPAEAAATATTTNVAAVLTTGPRDVAALPAAGRSRGSR